MSLRRPAVLLVSGLLALSSATPALAQSAGDEQYSDPLAGQGSATTPKSSTPSLTQAPQGSSSSSSGSSGSGTGSGSGTAGTSSSGESTPAAAAPAAGTTTELPRTGLDTGTLAVLGAALLLLGIGLRLRTADARF